jgi:hypothetical protein
LLGSNRRDGCNGWCRPCCQTEELTTQPTRNRVRPYPKQRNHLSPGLAEKRCARCGLVKTIEDFPRNRHLPDGHVQRCRACLGIERRERKVRRGSLETRLAWERTYYARNRERLLSQERARNAAVRAEVLAAYGHRCACCGETTAEFLVIDHVNGRGSRDRKELNLVGRALNLWLRRHGFPRDAYRLLCHNCNSARGHYGYCPHERATR